MHASINYNGFVSLNTNTLIRYGCLTHNKEHVSFTKLFWIIKSYKLNNSIELDRIKSVYVSESAISWETLPKNGKATKRATLSEFQFFTSTSKYTLHHVLKALWMHWNDTSKSSYKICDFMVLRERICVAHNTFEKWIYRMKYECENDEHNPCWWGPHKCSVCGVGFYALDVGIQFSIHFLLTLQCMRICVEMFKSFSTIQLHRQNFEFQLHFIVQFHKRIFVAGEILSIAKFFKVTIQIRVLLLSASGFSNY